MERNMPALSQYPNVFDTALTVLEQKGFSAICRNENSRNENRPTPQRRRKMSRRTAKLSMFWLIIYNLTGKRLQPNSAQDPIGILKLVTTGRKSGRPRELPDLHQKRSRLRGRRLECRPRHASWLVLQPAEQPTGAGMHQTATDQSDS
jgi:hypothetical protein